MVRSIMTRSIKANFLTPVIIIIFGLMLSACPLRHDPLAINYPSSDQGFRDAIDWNKTALSDKISTDKVKAMAHLRLSLLYSHYRNPDRDLFKALEHIDAYIAMSPDQKPEDAIINHRELLTATSDQTKTKNDSKSPLKTSMINKLKKENKALTQENDELKKTIEKLNELEVELEKKRKRMR